MLGHDVFVKRCHQFRRRPRLLHVVLQLLENSFSVSLIDFRKCVELREAIVVLIGWLGLLILIILRTFSLELFLILKVEWVSLLDPLEGCEIRVNSGFT